jgi:hypothetical protein
VELASDTDEMIVSATRSVSLAVVPMSTVRPGRSQPRTMASGPKPVVSRLYRGSVRRRHLRGCRAGAPGQEDQRAR